MRPATLFLLATGTLLATFTAAAADGNTTTASFALSGSGGMLVWHLGVAQALMDYGAVDASTHLAGISGGAVTASLLAAGVSPREAAAKLVPLVLGVVILEGASAGRERAPDPAKPDFGKMAGLLRAALRDLLPGDAPSRANGRLHIFASQVDPGAPSILGPPPPAWFDLGAGSGYSDTSDLINAAVASAYVPCAVGGAVATPLRGHLWIDGGAAASIDNLCASVSGGSGARCVEVAAVTLGPLGDASCTPERGPEGSNVAGTSPGYGAPTATSALPLDCAAYATKNGRTATADFHPLRVPLKQGAIAPGARVRTAFTQCDIAKFAAFQFGGGLGQAWAVHELGYKEGEAWAVEQGLVKGGKGS